MVLGVFGKQRATHSLDSRSPGLSYRHASHTSCAIDGLVSVSGGGEFLMARNVGQVSSTCIIPRLQAHHVGSATEGRLETQVTCGAQEQQTRTHHTLVHSALNTEAVQHVMSSLGGDPNFPAYIAHSENVPLQSSSMPIAHVTSSRAGWSHGLFENGACAG